MMSVSLRYGNIKGETFNRYTELLVDLLEYLSYMNYEIRDREIEVDLIMAEYVEFLESEEIAVSRAEKTLSALQFFVPFFRFKLPLAWRAVKTWQKRGGARHIIPIPAYVLTSIAASIWLAELPSVAVAFLIGFHCFLRPGEIASLRWENLDTLHGATILYLGETKTSRRSGKEESVTLDDPLVLSLLRGCSPNNAAERAQFLIPGRSPGARQRFLTGVFKGSLLLLECQNIGLRPASIRGGGTTFDNIQHGSMDRLLSRGRWKNAATAAIYVQPIAYNRAWLALSSDVRKRLETVSGIFLRFCNDL